MPVIAAQASQSRAGLAPCWRERRRTCYVVLRRKYSGQKRPPGIGGRSGLADVVPTGIACRLSSSAQTIPLVRICSWGFIRISGGRRYPRSARIWLGRNRESPLLAPKPTKPPASAMFANDPGRVKTFFLPQELHATGDDPHQHDGLNIIFLYRVRSQPGRKLGPR